MKDLWQAIAGRRLAFITVLLAVCGTLLFAAGAQAVHDDGYFQLDGDARTSIGSTTNAEDWDKICPAGHAPGAASCLGGTTANRSFFGDDDARIYTGGSTKDDLDITGWQHTVSSVPDKDELVHGYAARYGNHVYFGADRFANNGDSEIGVWFLQENVGPVTTGANAGSFSGAHKDGDVLVLSDFTKGGETPTVRVFRWNGPGGSIAGQGAIDGTLDIIGGQYDNPEAADCVGPPSVAAGDEFCATVNKSTQASPWAFTPKSGAAGSFQPGELFEGGLDLAALNLAGECFSSVILETRSSQSTDAVLKDFVAGSLELCGAAISVAPDSVDEVGHTQTFTIHVTQSIGGIVTGALGVHPTVTLTASDGAVITNVVDNCATIGANANGDCTLTVTSNTPGLITANASANVVIDGATFHVATTTADDAVKRFVDAKIGLSPLTAVNTVNDAHTFTATVQQDDGFAADEGDGISGFGAAPAGTNVTFTLLNNAAGASFVNGLNTCTTDAAGSCFIQINSPTPGTVTIHATTTFDVGGVSLTRATGSGAPNSADATKIYHDAIVLVPHISIAKTPDTQTIVGGSGATFTIDVTNDGETALTGVHVTDVLAPDCERAIGSLQAGAHASFQCTLANVTAGFTNTATATGTPPVGDDVTASDTADVTVISPHISVSKTPDTQTIVSGSAATFTIEVTNDGDVALSGVHVTDALAPDCERTIGALAAGAHASFQCTLADVTQGFTNTATAAGTPPAGDDVTATDTAEVTVIHPHITIAKSPDEQSIMSGSAATFTILVTNDGDAELTNVHVTDALAPDCDRALGSLAAGAHASYDCTLASVTTGFTNSATATGTPPVGEDVSATDTAHVTVKTPEPPTETPPATPPTVVVTHPGISIVKDPEAQTIAQGSTATFSITVTNTGDVSLLNVTVSDPATPGCDRSIGMLAPAASVSYTCTRPNVTAAFDNIAVATGTPPTGSDVSATDTARVSVTEPLPTPAPAVAHPAIAISKNPKSQTVARGGTAVFTITVTNTGDVELTNVSVSDPQSPDCNRTIGTIAPGARVTYTCSKTNVRAAFNNVAVANGTGSGTAVSALDTAPVKVAALKPPKRHVQKHVAKHPKKHVTKHPKVVSHKTPKSTG